MSQSEVSIVDLICCCGIPFFIEKLMKMNFEKSDKENLQHAIDSLSALEHYKVEDVIFDSAKYIDVSDSSWVYISIDEYKRKNGLNFEIEKEPLLYLVEMKNGNFRGVLAPRYIGQHDWPIHDSEAVGFTIDLEHGLQIVDDETSLDHQIFFEHIKRIDSMGDQGHPILEYGKFLSIRCGDLKWSEERNGHKESMRRFLIIRMAPKPECTIPPLIENEAMLRDYQKFIISIKDTFGIDPGKVFYDSRIPYDDIFKLESWEEKEDLVFLVANIDKDMYETHDYYVGFLPGFCSSEGKWKKAEYAAMGHIHKTDVDGKVESKFCPNRRPDEGCFRVTYLSQTTHGTNATNVRIEKELLIEFTKKWVYKDDDEGARMAAAYGARYRPKPNPVIGFMISLGNYRRKFVFRENKSFSSQKGRYDPMNSHDFRQFASYAHRVLIFSGMNVSQLEAKVKEALGEKGIYTGNSSDSSDDSSSSD